MAQKNLGDLMKRVTQMRKDIDRVNGELKNRFVEATVGGDAVAATFNGQQELVKLLISPALLQPGAGSVVDVDTLEDLILTAVNQGIEKSKALANDEMNDATGGLASSFPGLF